MRADIPRDVLLEGSKLLTACQAALACINNTDAENNWLNPPHKPEVTLGSLLRGAIADAKKSRNFTDVI